jgi:hypothetical protein
MNLETAESRRQKAAGATYRMLCCFLLSAFCFLASAATLKLFLKDGTYQLVTEYKVEDDRVKYFSTERGEWEEIPLDLVDLDKTKAVVKQREESEREEKVAIAEETKALKEAAREVKKIPEEPGVYLIDGDKLTPIKQGESKIVTNKRRSVLKALSPIPLVSGKATLELDGLHSSSGTPNREPEFYIRLSSDERFGIVRLSEHKGNRVVEKLTIVPVTKETIEEPDPVDVFRKQVGDQVYKLWPAKPLEPGEYAVVEYTEGKVNIQVWDFFVAPGIGK